MAGGCMPRVGGDDGGHLPQVPWRAGGPGGQSRRPVGGSRSEGQRAGDQRRVGRSGSVSGAPPLVVAHRADLVVCSAGGAADEACGGAVSHGSRASAPLPPPLAACRCGAGATRGWVASSAGLRRRRRSSWHAGRRAARGRRPGRSGSSQRCGDRSALPLPPLRIRQHTMAPRCGPPLPLSTRCWRPWRVQTSYTGR